MERGDRRKKVLQLAAAALFWLLVWQVASLLIDEVLFLPSPVQVAAALARQVREAAFWRAVGTSLGRIALGFALGLVVGFALAVASAALRLVEVLVRPLMQLVSATPVASFIILALLWVSSRWLSTFISFLMVLPVLYNATLFGIRSASGPLLEMAAVFRVGFWRKARAIWLPALMPSLLSSCELALGMCWKSGVAAEVIGLPSGTIGERLYQAKIFLQTPQLFGWTFVIILLSWLFGKLVLALLRAGGGRVTRGLYREFAAPGGQASQTAAGGGRPGDIVLQNIDKAYGGQQVLRGFSARLPGGRPTALMGPSGSGKTTLARLVMGLEKPDAGEILKPENTRFACVFQEDRLCEHLLPADNIALVLPQALWGRVPTLLHAVGLGDEIYQKPVESLSGGERRRVALARAVAAQSDVLVLDEAFKGLDGATRSEAFSFVNENREDRTLLVITHDADEAEAFGAEVLAVG